MSPSRWVGDRWYGVASFSGPNEHACYESTAHLCEQPVRFMKIEEDDIELDIRALSFEAADSAFDAWEAQLDDNELAAARKKDRTHEGTN